MATGEPEMRWMVAPCSSFTFHRLWRMTSNVTGSKSDDAVRCSLSFGEMRSSRGGT